jgi:hypothetical protein
MRKPLGDGELELLFVIALVTLSALGILWLVR